MSRSSDPGPRGRVFGAAGGAVALAVVLSPLLGCSHATGTSRETPISDSPPAAAAGQSPQLVPASQVAGPPSAPNGAAASGQGAAAKPGTVPEPPPHPRPGPTAPGTKGELTALALPPASPADSPNPVPPVPASRSVTVSAGPAVQQAAGTCTTGVVCYSFRVSIANFPAHVRLAYNCADGGGIWWGPSTIINGGTTETSTSGVASFITYCTHPWDGAKITIDVGGGGLAASGSFAT